MNTKSSKTTCERVSLATLQRRVDDFGTSGQSAARGGSGVTSEQHRMSVFNLVHSPNSPSVISGPPHPSISAPGLLFRSPVSGHLGKARVRAHHPYKGPYFTPNRDGVLKDDRLPALPHFRSSYDPNLDNMPSSPLASRDTSSHSLLRGLGHNLRDTSPDVPTNTSELSHAQVSSLSFESHDISTVPYCLARGGSPLSSVLIESTNSNSGSTSGTHRSSFLSSLSASSASQAVEKRSVNIVEYFIPDSDNDSDQSSESSPSFNVASQAPSSAGRPEYIDTSDIEFLTNGRCTSADFVHFGPGQDLSAGILCTLASYGRLGMIQRGTMLGAAEQLNDANEPAFTAGSLSPAPQSARLRRDKPPFIENPVSPGMFRKIKTFDPEAPAPSELTLLYHLVEPGPGSTPAEVQSILQHCVHCQKYLFVSNTEKHCCDVILLLDVANPAFSLTNTLLLADHPLGLTRQQLRNQLARCADCDHIVWRRYTHIHVCHQE
ncbi:hypothetical protein BKA70DRAFT_1430374 [Coprinopsis sp. MPI-PUGE-AT-0042]|nr:hypothetical protein BKA70DRAFT_1430374 [Coprinopsis sp. MPI-PUGE-AT-0042]